MNCEIVFLRKAERSRKNEFEYAAKMEDFYKVHSWGIKVKKIIYKLMNTAYRSVNKLFIEPGLKQVLVHVEVM